MIAPAWVIILAYVLLQISKLHALIVFRRSLENAQYPAASLERHKGAVARYELASAAAVSVSLLVAYLISREVWTMGVLALWGLGSIYFVFAAKHDGLMLYASLGIMVGTIVISMALRAYLQNDPSLMTIMASLGLILFAGVTSFAAGANARLDHFKRLDHEEFLEHAAIKMNTESQEKSALLAQLSHEIRTPLSGVLGAAELLTKEVLPKDQRNLVNVMRDSGANLVELLDRMLEISAAEIGAIVVKRRPSTLNGVLTGEADLFDSKANQAGITLGV